MKDLKEWWENESLINKLFVKPMVDLATLPGDVYGGEVDLFDPQTGNTSQELIERAANAAGTIPLAGLGAGVRPAANTLFAGAFPEGAATKTHADWMDKASPGVPISSLSDEEWAAISGDFAGDPTKKIHPDEVPFYTGNPDFDQKIAAGVALGWKPEVLLKVAEQPNAKYALGWYTSPSNFKDISTMFPDHPNIVQQTADEILKPKPLDTEKYPWLAKPSQGASDPLVDEWDETMKSTSILDRWDSQFQTVRNQLYLRGMSQDPLVEIQRLAQSGSDADQQRALEMSSELRALIPEDWDLRAWEQSTIVPHAYDTTRIEKNAKNVLDFPPLNVSQEQIDKAKALGFNTEHTLYRGTKSLTDQFLDPSMKGEEAGMFFADNPVIASNYGRYVYPVWARVSNPAEVDFKGVQYGGTAKGPWSSGDVNKHIEEARDAGHDILNFRNLRDDDPGSPTGRSIQDQAVLFDPSLLRSPWARFDPARLNENNLLAAQAGGVNPFSWLIPEEEKKKQLGQYRF